jgi:hypothetical protein
MEFNPTDAGDKGSFSLLPEGLYDIEVVDAEERSSKKGNAMIALTLEVRHPDGYPSRVWDYLVSTPAAVFKIKQFCDAAGLTAEFMAGTLTEAHCRNRKLKAKIFVDGGRDGYQDRNSIKEYVPTASSPGGIATMPEHAMSPGDMDNAVPTPAVTDEEIPF